MLKMNFKLKNTEEGREKKINFRASPFSKD
jgi:hypothetical protein